MTAPGARAALGPWLALAVALVAWLPSLWTAGFSYDDREALERNPVVEGHAPLAQAFRRDYWDHVSPAGHYRPLATLALRFDHARAGPTHARPWHATNVALHAAVVALAGLLLVALARGGRAPWIGLALFAAHPALADAVAWISGRSSMLAALGGLAGALGVVLLAPRSGALARTALALAAGAGLALALLGKEDGVVFAPLFALLAVRASRRALAASLVGSALGLALYLGLRDLALGSPWPAATHAPLAGATLVERLAVAGRAQLELARLVLWPLHNPPSYEGATALLAPSAGAALAGWALWLALALGGALAARRSPVRLAGWSALCAALALVPVQQWIPSGVVLAPRFLYLPLLLAVPALDAPFARLAARPRAALAALVLAAAVVGAWARAGVYADRASFHGAVLAARPDDPRAWNELGLAREESGDPAGAREAFEHAAMLDADYGRPWSNLGRLALAEGDLDGARDALERAARLGPGNAVAWHNLGVLELR
ncbi:MAG TPA: tetratricopeptide repeat protein, partial [Planctomycetota bacterium]|nr:tetratricopeptide repeat protein [Planctomycetota bacterium]